MASQNLRSKMWPSSQQYQRVMEKDTTTAEDFETKLVNPPENHRGRRYFLIIAVIVMTSTLTVGFVIHLTRPALLNNGISPSMGYCGNTTAEARANGCKFDLLSYSWMPEECFDHKTAIEFEAWMAADERAFGSWPFFEDKQMKKRVIDIETLSERTNDWTYSTNEEHFGHCLFLARRLHRIIDGEATLSSSFDHAEHTVHCTDKILEDLINPPSIEAKTAVSHFIVVFDTCN